jgi:hypothetical protein
MSTRLEQWSKEKFPSVIRFLDAVHVSAAEIRRQLVDVYGEEVTSCQSVAKLRSDFKSGRIGTIDNKGSGRQTTTLTALQVGNFGI